MRPSRPAGVLLPHAYRSPDPDPGVEPCQDVRRLLTLIRREVGT